MGWLVCTFWPLVRPQTAKKNFELFKDEPKIHMDINQCRVFMHDVAPCHRSTTVSDFLKNQKVEVLQWPGKSPDFKPYKNLWQILED